MRPQKTRMTRKRRAGFFSAFFAAERSKPIEGEGFNRREGTITKEDDRGWHGWARMNGRKQVRRIFLKKKGIHLLHYRASNETSGRWAPKKSNPGEPLILFYAFFAAKLSKPIDGDGFSRKDRRVSIAQNCLQTSCSCTISRLAPRRDFVYTRSWFQEALP